MNDNITFGQYLVNKGLLTSKDVDHALELQKKRTKPIDPRFRKIANCIILIKALDEKTIVREFNDFMKFTTDKIEPVSSHSLTTKVAQALTVGQQEELETIVLSIDDVSRRIIIGTIATESSAINKVRQLLNNKYPGYLVEAKKILEVPYLMRLQEGAALTGISYRPINIDIGVDEKLRTIFRDSIRSRAADISIEPSKGGSEVFFVIDNIREPYTKVNFEPEEAAKAIRALLVEAKIAHTYITEPVVDCALGDAGGLGTHRARINKMEGYLGQIVNIRLLPNDYTFNSVDSLNYTEANNRFVHHHNRNKGGIILFCGETNSGKNTSAFGFLSDLLKKFSIKVISVENPVEYLVPGVNQIQANSVAEYHEISRALVRQSPNVIYLSEMRDAITVDTAIEAAHTNKLVVSTIHLRHLYELFSRFNELCRKDVSSEVISELLGVVNQVLLPKACPHCKVTMSINQVHADFKPLLENYQGDIFNNTGKTINGDVCPHCEGRGVKGVVPVAEYLNFDYELKNKLRASKTLSEKEQVIIERMKATECSFKEDGLRHMSKGNVSLHHLIDKSILLPEFKV